MPQTGAEPLPWQLVRTGEYPWDEYSFVMLFAFNRTVNIGSMFSYVSLSSTLADEWKVVESFLSLCEVVLRSTRRYSIGFSQQDIDSAQGARLPTYLQNYSDFYALRIVFFRQSFEVLRGALAFWVPTIFLAALLIVAFGRTEALQLGEALTVFLGILLAALPFILSVMQFCPCLFSRPHNRFGEVKTH
jgi:hypothetical protein